MKNAPLGASFGQLHKCLAGDVVIAEWILPPSERPANDSVKATSRQALKLGDNSALRHQRDALLDALGAVQGGQL